MSRVDPHEQLSPSLLELLIGVSSTGRTVQNYYLDDLIADVQRDLEDMLNTLQSNQSTEEEYNEVQSSIVAYGLPELTSLSAHTAQQREEIGRVLEAAVGRFEPRLRDVRATLVESGDDKTPTLRFRIDATLHADPAPEVAFETVLELSTGRYSVRPTSP
jgi:type VI secretion system protein ImpF